VAKILIVEDNPSNLKLVMMLLRRVGHEVLSAVDAESGMALALSQHPDLILMDIQLPGMDGLTATRQLKLDPATAAIPIIALTALAMKEDEPKAIAAGCDAYIAKPLRYQQLYPAIELLLARNKPPAL
jgi:two-component system cell cycle response regulator DivK